MNETPTIQTRRAPVAPATWDPKTRTFEITFSTGAEVERFDARGRYVETLALDQQWPERLPFLDGHKHRDGLDAVLGFADNLRTQGGEARARVTLSRHSPKADRLAAELDDGNVFGISVGYVVHEYAAERQIDGRRVKTATRWQPLEISIELLPADRAATIRSHAMDNATSTTTVTDSPPAVQDRAAVNAEIRTIARTLKLGQPWIDQQIDAGATADQARAAALAEIQQRGAVIDQLRTATVSITADYTDPGFRARTIGEALYTRIDPAHKPAEAARPYVGLSIPEIARDCLRTRGIATTGFGAGQLVERALQTTSDFPIILGDTVGRTLRQAYGAAPSGVRRLARQTTARDFRAKYRVMLSAAPTLEKVNEHGEFKSGALAEAKESYSIATYGRIIGFTRQALVNDDLGAFADVARRMGQAAAAFEADQQVALLTSGSGNGPTMSDGKALFHTDHGNKAASGGAIAEATLSAARLAMRSQAGLLGELISVTPRYLLVSATNETAAEKTVSAIQATTTADVNPFASLSVVVEPRLSGTRWYLVADTAEIDGLEYAYLEGEPGPQIETRAGFEVDGVQMKIRLDYGTGFVDWRGWYANAGA